MLRAEKRLELTREKLAQEERAHAATKKKLAKLEARLGKGRAGKEEVPDEEPVQKSRAKEPRPSKAERREKRAWLRRSS
jgi:hypothetical protein